MKTFLNPNQLHGADLFAYYVTQYKDTEYRTLVKLLPQACGDMQKAYKILESSVNSGRKLYACYPPEKIPDGAEIIGSIPDGVLYLK